MSKITTGENSDATLLGIEIDGNVNWFGNTKSGKSVANEFAKLFHYLTTVPLSKARLNKLKKDSGNDNEAVS